MRCSRSNRRWPSNERLSTKSFILSIPTTTTTRITRTTIIWGICETMATAMMTMVIKPTRMLYRPYRSKRKPQAPCHRRRSRMIHTATMLACDRNDEHAISINIDAFNERARCNDRITILRFNASPNTHLLQLPQLQQLLLKKKSSRHWRENTTIHRPNNELNNLSNNLNNKTIRSMIHCSMIEIYWQRSIMQPLDTSSVPRRETFLHWLSISTSTPSSFSSVDHDVSYVVIDPTQSLADILARSLILSTQGKTMYFERHYCTTHIRLSATEEFHHATNNAQAPSLHRLQLRIVSLLKRGKNVVLDDENKLPRTRMSFFKFVHSMLALGLFDSIYNIIHTRSLSLSL